MKDKIKGIETEEYVYIPKWREEELLNIEDRIDKAVEYITKLKNHHETYDYDIDYDIQRDLLNILKGDNK